MRKWFAQMVALKPWFEGVPFHFDIDEYRMEFSEETGVYCIRGRVDHSGHWRLVYSSLSAEKNAAMLNDFNEYLAERRIHQHGEKQ